MTEFIRDFTSHTGFKFHLRPARPEDEAALGEFFARVTPEDLRFRFLSSVKEVGHDRLVAMTEVDHWQTESFLAFEQEGGPLIATAMLPCDADLDVGEVAISVRADHKNLGIGWDLLGHLTQYAKSKGVKRLQSVENRANGAAMQLEKELGCESALRIDPPSYCDFNGLPCRPASRPRADSHRWCLEGGLLDRSPAVDEHTLAKARELREAIQRVGESIVTSAAPASSDIARINVAASADVIPQLSADAAAAVWVGDGIEGALSRVARDAIELYSGPLRSRIRICSNPKCLGLFVDESRPGRRRWCSMSTCGDSAKKATFRKKSKSVAPSP